MKSIIETNRMYTDGLQNRRHFNKYFSFRLAVKSMNISLHQYLKKNFPISFVIFRWVPLFIFNDIQIAEVESIFLSLKENKTRVSTYANKILKYISDLLLPMLTNIMNKTITTGYFPKPLENARILQLVKTGD